MKSNLKKGDFVLRKKVKRKKGLTLLELVIVLGLMGIVTSLVFSFVNMTQKKSKEIQIRQELQHDGTIITESMMKNVLEAESLYAVEISNNANKNSITKLIFKIPQKDDNDAIMYYLEGDKFKSKLHDISQGMPNSLIDDCYNTPGILVDCTHWNGQREISKSIKEITIENETIKVIIDPILSRTAQITNTEIANISKAIAKEKSANLKIILEQPYYNETISHENTIELSFRNAK